MSRVVLRAAAPALAAAVAFSGTEPAMADSLTEARVGVDVRTPGAVELKVDLTWQADASRSALRFWLGNGVSVTAATADGAEATLASEDAAGTGLTAWTVTLPSPMAAGASRKIALTARVAKSAEPGWRIGEGGGHLLPGTAWFPQLAPDDDERVPHATTFVLPDGMKGIAAGVPRGAGSWQAVGRERPYAAWGRFTEASVDAKPKEGDTVRFAVWRRDGAPGEVPRLETVAGLLHVLEVGVGASCGSGDWKIVDVGGGVVAGGARTLFWDERAAAGSREGDAALLFDRDVAGALAVSFWTECLTFAGDYRAFLARAFPYYLGDVAYSGWEGSDERFRVEAVTLGARRSAFLQSRDNDRPMRGLVPAAPGAAELLASRGALVVHLLSESRPNRTVWMTQVRKLRADHAEQPFDWEALAQELPGVDLVPILKVFLDTTDLPDFRLVSHGPAEVRVAGLRYAVEVENRGAATGFVDVATFDGAGRNLFASRVQLEPGQKRTVMFGEPTRTARVEIDPRGVALQSDVSGERVEAERTEPPTPEELAKYVPSFSFSVSPPGARSVRGFHVELDGATVRDFDGWIVPYETHHGPSGACLVGSGTVTIHPSGGHAAPWSAAMGRDALTFENSHGIWLRFPVEKWKEIEPQLGDPVTTEDRADVLRRQTWIHQFSFPTYFYERNRAQVPPPGGTVVIFGAAGEERRGFARVPMPDGTVLVRFWDHLGGETLWEKRL